MTARVFAQIVGVVLLLLGVLGLLLGDELLLGLVNIDITEDIIHLMETALVSEEGGTRWPTDRTRPSRLWAR